MFVTQYFFFKLVYFSFIECSDKYPLDLLHKITQAANDYQITSFISNNSTKILKLQTFLLVGIPNRIYSFDLEDHEYNKIYPFGMSDHIYHDIPSLKNVYALQESLIIFYTSDFNEIKKLTSFLTEQLAPQKRPKCLILYSNNFEYFDKTDVVDIMKYAWKNSFLDFSIVRLDFTKKNSIDRTSKIDYFNPFNDIIYQKELDENSDVFPDKLRDAHGYPFYIPLSYVKNKVIYRKPLPSVHVRRSKKKVKIYHSNHSILNLITKVLNLRIVPENVTIEPFLPGWYLQTYRLDVYPLTIVHSNMRNFLIPADKASDTIVAVVPILDHTQSDVSFKTLYIIMIMIAIVTTILYKHLKKYIKLLDIVRLILSQPMKQLPIKAVNRIICIAITVSAIKMKNDFYFGLLLTPSFETREDLYDSGLQTYTDIHWLISNYVPIKDNRSLSNLIKKTLFQENITDCFNSLKEWKNISCIVYQDQAEIFRSKFCNLDGTYAMKIAHPSIHETVVRFYWFVQASPYAMRFLEILRRIKETNLIGWEALFDENSEIIDDRAERVASDCFKLKHLIFILFFGLTISSVVFFIEIFESKTGNKLKAYNLLSEMKKFVIRLYLAVPNCN